MRARKRKKLAEASFYSLPGATANDLCYLRSVPGQALANAHAICMVPSLPEVIAPSASKFRMTGTYWFMNCA